MASYMSMLGVQHAYLLYEYQRRWRAARRRRARIYRTRVSLLDMSESQCLATYRFDKAAIMSLLEDIAPDLESKIVIGTAIPPVVKVLSVLHFCASGSFQGTIAQANGLSQPTFCQILKQVLRCMMSRLKSHIRFPRTEPALTEAKAGFYTIAGFPNVIGCVDCTHVALVPPRAREQVYRNRKGQHTINVQAVCDSKLCFTQCCARFPGSSHDALILRCSALPGVMEDLGRGQTWLLGDSGYPLKPWLLTPYRNPQTPAELRYNKAHIKTRNTIERAFGMLKSRFRCLDRSGGALLYAPSKVCDITLMCMMLHNLAITRNMPPPPEEDTSTGGDVEHGEDEDEQEANDEGSRIRSLVTNNFFNVP